MRHVITLKHVEFGEFGKEAFLLSKPQNFFGLCLLLIGKHFLFLVNPTTLDLEQIKY